jgi:hypothetical protein
MSCAALIRAMAAMGYWTSPGGKTPAGTLYSALLRELQAKGDQARFVQAARGQVALRQPLGQGCRIGWPRFAHEAPTAGPFVVGRYPSQSGVSVATWTNVGVTGFQALFTHPSSLFPTFAKK